MTVKTGNEMQTSIISFPVKTCCMCEARATREVKVTDLDSGEDSGIQLFCAEHFPTQPGLIQVERLTERCEAYKAQVKDGAEIIERLTAALQKKQK